MGNNINLLILIFEENLEAINKINNDCLKPQT